MKYQIGVVGLAVMGRGLALNLAERGFSVAGYNLEPENTDAFVEAGKNQGFTIGGFYTYSELCQALERPRKILVMVKAGKAVDMVLQELLPHLDADDIVIDGGNSFYLDTLRRNNFCAQKGVRFIGMGVSGGEEGARHGASIMPGGDKKAYAEIEPFLTTIAAKVEGEPCCCYIGPEGSGHFVKMIHNGIEYGDMQLICEAYYLMKKLLKMSAADIGEVFYQWNQGELSSYLIEITAKILKTVDEETNLPMVDVISPEAGSKGTGMWTSQIALELGVPLPTITQAVFSRYMSAMTAERGKASRIYPTEEVQWNGDRDGLLEDIRKALFASKVCSYAQGFTMLKTASDTNDWGLNLSDIALIFRGGCIIRAAFLQHIADACASGVQNILLDDFFARKLGAYQNSWRRVAALALEHGISAPAFTASLSYFDGYRDPSGPLNLLQAQRDCFGAHTFRRIDKEGVFHYNWN